MMTTAKHLSGPHLILLWTTFNRYPAAVDEDLGGVGDGGRGNLFQVLHAPLLQELENG